MEARRLRRDIAHLKEKIEDLRNNAQCPGPRHQPLAYRPHTRQPAFLGTAHMSKPNPIFCAIDTADLDHAKKLAEQLHGHVGGIKLGLEFFLKHGAQGYREMSGFGLPIFLDVKLHDIPNTVTGAMNTLGDLQPSFITIHTSGGAAMMKAAVKAASTIKSTTKITRRDGVDQP